MSPFERNPPPSAPSSTRTPQSDLGRPGAHAVGTPDPRGGGASGGKGSAASGSSGSASSRDGGTLTGRSLVRVLCNAGSGALDDPALAFLGVHVGEILFHLRLPLYRCV